MTNNYLLEWELEWVRKNTHLYEGPYHVKAVCENIRKNYELRSIKKAANEFSEHGTTQRRFNLLVSCGIKV